MAFLVCHKERRHGSAVIECEASQQKPSVCLQKENPHGPMDLWKMLQIYAHEFVKLIDNLRSFEADCKNARHQVDDSAMGDAVGRIAANCDELQLVSARKQVDRINKSLDLRSLPLYTELGGLLSELRIRIQEDLEEHVFYQVGASKVNDFFKRVSDDDGEKWTPKTAGEVFGRAVTNKFPSASWDLAEASKCLVTSRNTACVFHLMRALELGLGALGKPFAVSLDHTNWGTALDQIEKAIRAMPANPAWKGLPDFKAQHEFYSQVASHFGILKDAWRNYTAHARGRYDEEEAWDILRNVRGFMQKLATRLHE
jgi:hypothetical protein